MHAQFCWESLLEDHFEDLEGDGRISYEDTLSRSEVDGAGTGASPFAAFHSSCVQSSVSPTTV